MKQKKIHVTKAYKNEAKLDNILELIVYPKVLTRITDSVLQAKNLNFLQTKTLFYISNSTPIVSLQMDAQKDLLELLNTYRKMEVSGSLHKKLNTFLFTYRITPQSTSGMSPAKHLMIEN